MYNNPGNKPKHIKRINPFTPLSGYRNSPKTLCVYTLVCVRVTTCTVPCRAEMWVSVRIVHSCTVRHRAEGVCVVCGWQCPILKCVFCICVYHRPILHCSLQGSVLYVWQLPTTLGGQGYGSGSLPRKFWLDPGLGLGSGFITGSSPSLGIESNQTKNLTCIKQGQRHRCINV